MKKSKGSKMQSVYLHCKLSVSKQILLHLIIDDKQKVLRFSLFKSTPVQ